MRLTRVEGALSCGEMSLDNAAAKKHFERALNGIVRLGTPVNRCKAGKNSIHINGEEFDYAINCTYNTFAPLNAETFKYEACVMFAYSSERFVGALTVMDGEFASLYPAPGLGVNVFLLSGVKETCLSTHASASQAQTALEAVSLKQLESVRKLMEAKIQLYYPSFASEFRYLEPRLSLKTKPRNEADSRRWYKVQAEGRLIHAFSSKISNIFPVAEEVKQALGLEKRKVA